MNFTPSKGQEDWAPVLEAMLPSLKSFGHAPPKLVFTDNIRADKDRLLSVFPSLSTDVTPVPTLNDAASLMLPPDWSSVLLTSTHQVNHRFNIIMNHHTDENPVVVALSVQWPLDIMKAVAGCVSLIQVAYQGVVYLIQVSQTIIDNACKISLLYPIYYRQSPLCRMAFFPCLTLFSPSYNPIYIARLVSTSLPILNVYKRT